MRRGLCIAFGVLSLLAASPTLAAADSYVPTGPLVADSGFRPQTDGFGFANYTKDQAYSPGLGVHEMRQLFGDGVCASQPADDSCALTSAALTWETNENNSMGGGHCYGMSITALRLFSKNLVLTSFVTTPPADGAPPPTAATLTIQDPGTQAINWPLAHTIGYDFAMQELDSVNAATFKGTPAEVAQKLIQVLPTTSTAEQYSMSVFKPGFKDGHEITPYAVEDQGNGNYGVLVYDNNYPGETHVLTIDSNANTWAYQAAPDPGQQPDLYQGDASTKTLQLNPVSPGLGVQPCPFCGAATAASAASAGGASAGGTSAGGASASAAVVHGRGRIEVQLNGDPTRHAHLLIQDSRGGAIGFRGARLVQSLRGAGMILPRVDTPNLRETPEPRYLLDPSRGYTITLDNTSTGIRGTEGVAVTGPGFEATANALNLTPGEKVTLTLSPGGRKLTLRSNRRLQAPVLSLGAPQRGSDHALTLRRRTGLNRGQTLALALNTRTDKLTIIGAPARYDIVMRYAAAHGAATWARRNVRVSQARDHREQGQATVAFAGYNPDSPGADQVGLEVSGSPAQELGSQVPANASSDVVIEEYSNDQSYSAPPVDPNADPSDGSGDGGVNNSTPANTGDSGIPVDNSGTDTGGGGGDPAPTG